MDPLTLLQSHNVSKYWRFNASKNRVKILVLERYVNTTRATYGRNVLIHSGGEKQLLDYPANYPIDNRLRDIALAEKRGKKLLELELENNGHYVLNNLLVLYEQNEYIIKTKATLENSYPQFKIGVKYITPGNNQDLKSILSFHEDGHNTADQRVQYEVMLDLDTYCKQDTYYSGNLHMVRNLSQKRKFGFIPLDDSFVKVMLFILIPLIVHDVLYSESFMNILKQWFGAVAFLVLNVFITYENLRIAEHFRYQKNFNLYRTLTIQTSILSIIGAIFMHPVSSTHFGFLGTFIGTVIYAVVLYDFTFTDKIFHFKSKNKLQIFVLCTALVFLMNDWPMTVRSMIDGALWPRLFWNTVHYLVFLLYVIWINAMACMLHDNEKSFSLKYFITWQTDAVKVLARFYFAVIFVTLYAPYWQENH